MIKSQSIRDSTNTFMVGDIVVCRHKYSDVRVTVGDRYKVVDVKEHFIYLLDNSRVISKFNSTLFYKDQVATRNSIISDILE